MTAASRLTMPVMADAKCGSVWSYAFDGNGAVSTYWVAKDLVDDLGTIGLSEERIITKSDQGNPMVQLQKEIGKLRKGYGTAFGTSNDCYNNPNGKV